MKKLSLVLILFTTIVLGSCQTPVEEEQEPKRELTPEEIILSIRQMDDSLKTLMDEAVTSEKFQINPAVYYEAINRNKLLFLKYPEDPFVEGALEKIAAIYLQINHEEEAVKWRDTLLNRYPNTENRLGILELQMNYYDFNEYTPEKIEYYANQLLNSENISEEKRTQIEFRLEHLDKTFEELILLQMDAIQ